MTKHMYTGPQEFRGKSGPITLYGALCDKLLKTKANITEEPDRATCPACRRKIEKRQAFLR